MLTQPRVRTLAIGAALFAVAIIVTAFAVGSSPNPESTGSAGGGSGGMSHDSRAEAVPSAPPGTTAASTVDAPAIGAAGAFAAQRRRAEHLTELDRTKTAFFAGISDQFRTPLALVLGPVAIVLSNQAKGEIAATGGVQPGAGQARAGFILGIIGIVLWVLGLIARVALSAGS